MADIEELKDKLEENLEKNRERRSGRTKGKGTHYFRFEKEEEQEMYDIISDIVGTRSPTELQDSVLDFIKDNLGQFDEEQG